MHIITYGNKTYGETQTYARPYANTPDIYKNVSKDTAGETLDYYTTPTTNTSTQETSLEVKQTYYVFSNTRKNYFDDTIFHELVFGTGSGYLLATRVASCASGSAWFGLRVVSVADINSLAMFNSDGSSSYYSRYLRPVVSLGSDIHISETGGTEDAPRTLSKI